MTTEQETKLLRELAELRGQAAQHRLTKIHLEAARKSLARRVPQTAGAVVLTEAEVRVIAEGLSRLGRTAVILDSVIGLGAAGEAAVSIRECPDFKNILAIFASKTT